MYRKLIILLLLVCFFFSTSNAPHTMAASSPMLSITTDQIEAAIGQKVRVTVRGENLKDLYGYEIQLQYDSQKLKFKNASSYWTGFQVPVQEKNGLLIAAHTKIGNSLGEGGSQPLMTFTFEAIVRGEAKISLTMAKLVDSEVAEVTLTPNAITTVSVLDKQPAIAFSDMEGHWSKEAVLRSASIGFVNGFPDGTFRPNLKITRAEFAAMLVRAMSLEQSEGVVLRYKDAEKIPSWAKPFIAEASSAGVIQGYPDGNFRAGNTITRAEMTVMLVRAAQLPFEENTLGSQFADADQIPEWASAAVSVAHQAGIVQGMGNGNFDPNSATTRAQATVAILKLLDSKFS
ncbi:S-layer homology domain-containing protein [Candidatus Pristimantibacillus sp. PTI5]|uniref:S-layer homology domain-containing protein n=1 Tax=Candidatus Pristimantibacillus sp. PTI5 TaxID=3400422 RepID=UPI003B022A05